MADLFGECELGAEPPIGCMFGMPTVMDESLFADDRVTFQAGTHTDAVTMSLADYRRAAMPPGRKLVILPGSRFWPQRGSRG